jgi:hypothetical protein
MQLNREAIHRDVEKPFENRVAFFHPSWQAGITSLFDNSLREMTHPRMRGECYVRAVRAQSFGVSVAD